MELAELAKLAAVLPLVMMRRVGGVCAWRSCFWVGLVGLDADTRDAVGAGDGEERSGCGTATRMQSATPVSGPSKGVGAGVFVMLASPGAMIASHLSALRLGSMATRGSSCSPPAPWDGPANCPE